MNAAPNPSTAAASGQQQTGTPAAPGSAADPPAVDPPAAGRSSAGRSSAGTSTEVPTGGSVDESTGGSTNSPADNAVPPYGDRSATGAAAALDNPLPLDGAAPAHEVPAHAAPTHAAPPHRAPAPDAPDAPRLGARRYTAAGPRRPQPRVHRALLAVSGAVAVLAAFLVPLTLPLGWDELVYASRFPHFDPATPFSSPRTRGVPMLLAPVAMWTDSVLLLRIWLTLLASAALYLGFRPWLRVVRRQRAVPLAAAAYGTLWISLFYTGSAMPNHYTAMGSLAAVGYFLGRRPSATGIAVGLALATLMRPNDAVWIAGPLLVGALLVPAWRRRSAVLGTVAGVALGALPWVVEAYVRFGGIFERLSDASDVQGGMRPVVSLIDHATALDGPLLCRPCGNDSLDATALELWLLLPVFTVLGMMALRRAGQARGPYWMAVAVALASAAPYFFLLDYAAPRFLLPTYALLLIPAAVGVLAAWDAARGAKSRLPLVGLALVLVAHLAVQLPLARTHANVQIGARGDWVRVAEVLRANDVRPPCTLKATTRAIPLAHTAGCEVLESRSPRVPDAVVYRGDTPPRVARGWPSREVPDVYADGWMVAFRPSDAG
ncbi:hypothetical protein [Streptomyces tardus]|uniref:hypothetical protein n=1 Tax=Streptomyces tardus TaxID=2780544 RepID=UPI001F48FD6B|nr:hypothetical protein [Streptomyces tardus]